MRRWNRPTDVREWPAAPRREDGTLDNDRLRKILEDLQEELRHKPDIDGKGREIIEHLSRDIRDLLGRLEEGDDEGRRHPINEGLRQAVQHFEASHPDFSTALGRVLDALAGMGF